MTNMYFLFYSYVFLGFIFIFLNKFIGSWVYKLTLLFTDRLKISDMFIFRIDSKNRDSFFYIMRSISILLGIVIISLAVKSFY